MALTVRGGIILSKDIINNNKNNQKNSEMLSADIAVEIPCNYIKMPPSGPLIM